ncbi:MAG TPA: biopolymer transporter ExbD, partial [Thermoanaerobaculia bacterium]
MGMDVGGHGGPKSEINVTPLVDVVLVLLIIFMVVQPLLQRGYEVQVPPNAPAQPNTPPPTDQIIVSLTANKEYYLNKEKVEPANIAIRLQEVLRNRSSKVVFFSAEDTVKYDDAMKLMDIVRNSGSGDKKVNIGIVMDWVNP